jgi:hypothetical protein
MASPLDVERLIRAMLDKGWRWSLSDPDVLLHPADHGLFLRLDRAAVTLTPSQALVAALQLVIPTPRGKSRSFWRS